MATNGTVFVSRAIGNSEYQYLEIDLASQSVVAAWPIGTSREEVEAARSGCEIDKASKLVGEAKAAYSAATKGRKVFEPFNCDLLAAAKVTPNFVLSGAKGETFHVARIFGADYQYRFNRVFLEPAANCDLRCRFDLGFVLEDGIYESSLRMHTEYFQVENGECRPLDLESVEAMFPSLRETAPSGSRGRFDADLYSSQLEAEYAEHGIRPEAERFG